MKLLGGPWSKGDLITAIGLIATILAVPGMPKLFHWDNEPAQPAAKLVSQPQTALTFSGQVSTIVGKPIPGATVTAFQDQTVGQTIKTDTNGQFQIQVSPETQSLRLIVSAVGFANSTIQANAHRTGPEEIVLQPATPSTRRQKNDAAAPSVSHAPDQTKQPPPTPPPTQQGNCNVYQNGGIGNAASPTCNPDPMAITKQYYCDGQALARDPNAGAVWGVVTHPPGYEADFSSMQALGRSQNYSGLLKLCSEETKQHPEWPTPLLFCAVANDNLGNTQAAVGDLKRYDDKKKVLMDVSPPASPCDMQETELKQRYSIP